MYPCFQVVSVVVLHCVVYCCLSQTCYFLTNRTNHLDAESVSWLERFLERFPLAPSWRLRMTVISWITWLSGFFELDRGMGFLIKVTILLGLSKECPPRAREQTRRIFFKALKKKNLNGFVQMPKVSRRKTKRVWSVLKRT